MKRLFLLLLSVVLVSCTSVQMPLEVLSPNGEVKISLDLTEEGSALYSVSYKDKPVILESPLALDFKQGGVWGKHLTVQSSRMHGIVDRYGLVVGKSDSAVNKCMEMVVELKETIGDKRKINLIFRAYDDGAAFRYAFPEQNALQDFDLLAERTEFRFPEDASCWALFLDSFTTSYENEFTATTINAIASDALVGLPLTLQFENGPTVCLTEANLTDYAGMYVQGAQMQNTLASVLSPLPGEEVCVHASTPHVSPWRVIMIGDSPGDLIESNLILNLNDPIAIKDPSWIKAGKVAWDWWSGQVVGDANIESGMNNETMKYYIDFAAEAGLPYMLIDAGWYGMHRDQGADITKTIPDIDMPALVQYANEKNVDIMIWLNWAGVQDQIDEAFPLYEQWGVKGVKIDYMNRDDQEMVNFYHNTVKKAAEHHLLVDFHGAYKPTGIRRTWPNLMTREGVLGLEYLKWSERATPEHNVTIPFTRMVAGPMDYTPGAFLNVTPDEFKSQRVNPMAPTTRCQQLAMYVVYESPLQMLSDAPSHYRGEPGLDFLEKVPATWDETKVISGKIGDYVAIARRSGTTWYIGAMTDEEARTLDLPLGFLGEGNYNVTMWSDGPAADTMPTRVTKSETVVTAQDKLQAEMAPGGGAAIVLQPAP